MKDCAPIDSLDALLSWKPDPDYLVNLSPLVNCDYLLDEAGYAHRNTPSASQVVYCHDMAGNYHETDRNLTFTTSFPAFRFFRWHLIDIFVYFSHHLITVPPISWINLAHRQGVRVYGTFILESDQCKAYREVFINPSESSRLDHSALAFRLDQLRRLGGFEGWLMNFEVSLPQDKKEATRLRIREFLSLLRKLGSDVIWYDALTWSGPLIWQNSLTVENEPFFKVADGLFLNYCWNQDKLRDSQERAGSSEASSRIFVGVDCFGRGCPGGGGFQTCKALNMILDVMVTRSDRPLSVALFAPGWAYEKSDLSSTESNPAESHALVASRDLKFWSLIAPYLHRIRGMSMGCTVLYRPAIPRLPVLQTLESAKESCQSGLLLRSTCCSGQGFFPTIGYYGSCMNWQQLIPTGRQCFESPDKNRGDNMLSQKPEFTAIQVLSSGICKPTGNCLLICPTQERRSKGSAVSFMELFSFGPHNYISNVSFLNLSISPVDLNESENTDTFKESINLHLFVDFADGPSSTTDLLCSSPKGAKTERQMLAPYSTSVGTHDSRVWISYTFSFNQLVRSEISDLIELRRIGLRWKIPAEDSGGYDQLSPPSSAIWSRLSSSFLSCGNVCSRGVLRLASSSSSSTKPIEHPTSPLTSAPKQPYGRAVTRLRIPVPGKEQRLSIGEGVGGGKEGRIMQLRRLVPTLLDHERMEVPWEIGTETRLYTERLIQEAIRASCEQDTLSVLKVWLESEQTEMRDAQAGLCGSPILEMVVFWLTKPSLVEKLFKVFVPRYRFYSRPYTSIFRIQGPNYPSPHPNRTHAILELHGNPWPPVLGHLRACRGPGGAEPFKNHYLINVLVASARNSARLLQQSSTPSSPDVVKSSV